MCSHLNQLHWLWLHLYWHLCNHFCQSQDRLQVPVPLSWPGRMALTGLYQTVNAVEEHPRDNFPGYELPVATHFYSCDLSCYHFDLAYHRKICAASKTSQNSWILWYKWEVPGWPGQLSGIPEFHGRCKHCQVQQGDTVDELGSQRRHLHFQKIFREFLILYIFCGCLSSMTC